MRGIPFQDKLDELFRGNGPAWKKILGAAAAAGVAVYLILHKKQNSSAIWMISERTKSLVGASAAIVGGFLAAIFLARDAIRRKVDHGVHVHPVLAWVFAYGRFEGIGMIVLVIIIVGCIANFL